MIKLQQWGATVSKERNALAKESREMKAELEALKKEHERCHDRISARDVRCCELEQEKRVLEDELSSMRAEVKLLREVSISMASGSHGVHQNRHAVMCGSPNPDPLG